MSTGLSPGLPSGLFIGGEWRHETAAGEMEHVNPATGRVQASFPIAGAAEVADAVEAARAGLKEFRQWSIVDRRDLLHRIAQQLRAHSEELAVITTLETGTPLSLSLTGSATVAADWFDYYAGWTDKLNGDVVGAAAGFDYTLLEPYGAVAIVLTWNGPTGSIGMKVAAALAAGCSVVIKPPELAPFSSSRFAALCAEAGVPPGVVNVVAGGPEVGQALVSDPRIDKISFTGGPRTAALLQAACAPSLTPMVLELGGKAANIVFADADLERAAQFAATGIIARSGQVCVAPTRLLIQDEIYDDLIERVAGLFANARIGDPMDEKTAMGPVISSQACDRILGEIDRARRDGDGHLVTGGVRCDGDLADGFFIEPTLFGDVDNDRALAQQEVFGPVLAATRFATDDEAVAIANDSPFGLAAYVHTAALARAHRVAAELDVGNVGINGGRANQGPYGAFGGVKDSGYGKEGGWSGIAEFLRMKNVNINLD